MLAIAPVPMRSQNQSIRSSDRPRTTFKPVPGVLALALTFLILQYNTNSLSNLRKPYLHSWIGDSLLLCNSAY
jgi:hypothetical protein